MTAEVAGESYAATVRELGPGERDDITLSSVRLTGSLGLSSSVGQSFLRSYAKLTSAAPGSQDIVAYYGATKAV